MSEADLKLRAAIVNGNIAAIKSALNGGADPNYGLTTSTPLAYAMSHLGGVRRCQVIKLLLQHGADVHWDEDYMLRYFASIGDTKLVALLLAHGADVHVYEDLPLQLAVINGSARARAYSKTDHALDRYVNTAKLLLNNGADISALSANQVAFLDLSDEELKKLAKASLGEAQLVVERLVR